MVERDSEGHLGLPSKVSGETSWRGWWPQGPGRVTMDGLGGAKAQLVPRPKGSSRASLPLLRVYLRPLITQWRLPRAGWAKRLPSSPREARWGGGSPGPRAVPSIPIPHWAEGRGEVPGQRPPEWLELFPQLISFLGRRHPGRLLGDSEGKWERGSGDTVEARAPQSLRALRTQRGGVSDQY